MRKSISLFSLALALVLLAGCRGGAASEEPLQTEIFNGITYPRLPEQAVEKRRKSEFPKGKIKSIEQLPIDLLIEHRELRLFKRGDYLLVQHLEFRRGAYLLHLISLKTNQVLAELAPWGDGPDDFTDCRVIETTDPDKLFLIRRIWDNKLFYISPDYQLVPYGELPEIPDVRLGFEGMFHLGSDSLLCLFDSGEGEGIGVIHLKDTTARGITHFHFAPGADSYFYLGDLAYNRKKERLAWAFLYFDQIFFSDLDGRKAKMIQYGDPQLRTLSSSSNTMYYYDCGGGENYVYTIHQHSENERDHRNGRYLEQYDWDGNLIARYRIPDERWMMYFGCATEDDHVVYMVDYDQDLFIHKVTLEWE